MSEKPIHLEDWVIYVRERVIGDMTKTYLQFNGYVYGHQRFNDGTKITTSPISKINVETGLFRTKSGSTYKLGKRRNNYNEESPF